MNKKIVMAGVGIGVLLAGVTLTFKYWLYVQMVFFGVVGPALAVAGLVCLTMLKD